MSRFIKQWLTSSNEDNNEDQKVVVQDGETPKDDFSDASNEQSGDADTAKPAVAELDAASDDAPKHTTKDQGHQKVTVSSEDSKEEEEEEEKDEEEEREEEEESSDDDSDEKDEESEEKDEEEDGEESEAGEEEEEAGEEEASDDGEQEEEASSDDAEAVKEEVDEQSGEEPASDAEEGGEEEEAGKTPVVEEGPAEEAPAEAEAQAEEESVSEADDVESEAGDPEEETAGDAEVNGDVEHQPVTVSEETESGEAETTGGVKEGPQHDVPKPEEDVSADTKGTEEASGEGEGDVSVSAEEDESLDVGITSPEEKMVEDMNQVAQDGAHFDKVSESLEAYHSLLTKALERGDGIDSITAESIRIGLEHMDESFSGDQLIPSNEAFGQTSSRQYATQVSLESVQSGFKATIAAGKKAMEKLFELLRHIWGKFNDDVAGTKKKLDQLKKEVESIESGAGSKKVNVKGGKRLMVSGVFGPTKPETIKAMIDVSNYMFNQYPRQYESMIKEGIDIMSTDFSKSKDLKATMDLTARELFMLPQKHIKPLPGSTDVKASDLPDHVKGYEGIKRSSLLPGDRALVLWVQPQTRIESFVKGNNNPSLSKFSYFDFVPVNTGTNPEMDAVDLPSMDEIKGMLKSMETLVKVLEDSKNAQDKYEQIRRKMSSDKVDVTFKIVRDENNGKSPSSIGELLVGAGTNLPVRTLNELVRNFVKPTGDFHAYVASTAKAYASTLEYFIKTHKQHAVKEEKEKEKGETA